MAEDWRRGKEYELLARIQQMRVSARLQRSSLRGLARVVRHDDVLFHLRSTSFGRSEEALVRGLDRLRSLRLQSVGG